MNDNVDYSAPAELYPASKQRRGQIGYHRFESLAEAVRFAIEELDPRLLTGAFIEIDDMRFGSGEILTLYDSDAYPLPRPAGANSTTQSSPAEA